MQKTIFGDAKINRFVANFVTHSVTYEIVVDSLCICACDWIYKNHICVRQ